METYKSRPCVTEDIVKQRILYVEERKSLEITVKILKRYRMIGLDAKVHNGRDKKYVTHIILATSNEIFIVDVGAILRGPPHSAYGVWCALGSFLNNPEFTKIGYNVQKKQQLIKDVIGGVFLRGVIDINEAFRAIELTNGSLTASFGVPCEGLRALQKICYNLLDKQIPCGFIEAAAEARIPIDDAAKFALATEAFVVLRAYIELDRRVRPKNLPAMIQELLKEPEPEEYLTLSVPWESVKFVDSRDRYFEAVKYLKSQELLGFDSEWKPTQSKAPNRMALLQLASEEKVYLFDVLALKIVLTPENWESLKSIFSDEKIVKLGFDTRDDSKLLEDMMGPLSIASVSDMGLVMRAMGKLRPDTMYQDQKVFPVARGLSRLCNILLGKPLNKSKKLSMTNWEKRPLDKVFLVYAALDAHCLVLCWKELLRRLGPNAERLIEISVIAYNVETELLKCTV